MIEEVDSSRLILSFIEYLQIPQQLKQSIWMAKKNGNNSKNALVQKAENIKGGKQQLHTAYSYHRYWQ